MKKFIISIDAGTTSNRSILFNLKGKPVFPLKKSLLNIFLRVVGSNMIQRKFGGLLLKL